MSAELRPRIKVISKLKKNEVIDLISKKVEDQNNTYSGWAKSGYALVFAPINEKHIWTPQLNLQIDETEEGTEIRGVIGPSASVWTAFVFTFALLGFIAFVALLWGLSRLSLDLSTDILWLVPVSLLLIFGIYMIARVGQQLSKKEVQLLKKFVEETFNN